MNIRNVTLEDAESVLTIYAPYITDTVITFETEVPTIKDFTERIECIKKDYPYLVYELDGKVVGYAYASKHGLRAAYKYSVDVSIYVSKDHHGQGIGRALYTRLFELLEKGKFYTAYAGITLPNKKSVELHQLFGFHEVGIYHNVGYKQNKWLDVIYLEKQIKEYDTIPDKKNK